MSEKNPTANELLDKAADLIEEAAEKRGDSQALFDMAQEVRWMISYRSDKKKKAKKAKIPVKK